MATYSDKYPKSGGGTVLFDVDDKGVITFYENRDRTVITGSGFATSRTTVTDKVKLGTLQPGSYSPEFTNSATTENQQFFNTTANLTQLKQSATDTLAKGLEKNGADSGDATVLAQRTISGKVVDLEQGKGFTFGGVTTFDNLDKDVDARDVYPTLVYPKQLDTTKQDVIKFTLKELKKIAFSGDLGKKAIKKEYTNLEGSVTLPIQPTISDSNEVKWGESELNPIQAAAFGASLNAMGSLTADDMINSLGGSFKAAQKEILGKEQYKRAILTYLAEQAVGSQGLLSRTTGQVLNPNLELLFQGPTLRPFTFQFRLSPRNEPEAKEVKQIIRFFKQAMSVKTTASSVFLKSPHVFDIRYLSNNQDHTSLNRIKTCALLGCDVDYTPDGSYMTFNDEDKTMTSYGLTLRFNELEPIYDSDYNKGSGADGTTNIHTNITEDEIGF